MVTRRAPNTNNYYLISSAFQHVNHAREEIAFLARSENRVAVFMALSSDPLTRDEIQSYTDVARVTLGRILSDFEDRNWIEKTGRQYTQTPTGEMVSGMFEELLETVDTAEKLDGVVQWLPTEQMPFPLQHLGSADITLPDAPDPAAPTRRAGQRLVDTSHVRIIMAVIVAEVVEACWEATVKGSQQFEAVFTQEVLETVTGDPVMSEQVQEMLESQQVTVYCANEDFPYIMGLLDDIVAFGVTDEENLPRAYFETQNQTVRAWVEETYEQYRETATKVEIGSLSN